MMKKNYYIYGADGILMSMVIIDAEEAARQTNITDKAPPPDDGRVPFFVNGEWELRAQDSVVSALIIPRSYPSIGDQLDMLWHAMDSGEIPKASAFYESIKLAKELTPRGEKPEQVFEVGTMPEA